MNKQDWDIRLDGVPSLMKRDAGGVGNGDRRTNHTKTETRKKQS